MEITQYVPPNDPPASEALAPLFRTSIAFIVLTTLIVFLRFFSVLVLRAKRLALWWDDWLLLPAWLCIIGCCITSLQWVHYETMTGATKHTIFVDPNVTRPIAQIIFADTQLQAAGYALTRLSILALYDRLFIGHKTKLVTYGMIAFVVAQWVAYSISGIFLCWPVDYAWNRTLGPLGGEGSCGDFNLFFRATTPPNIASDVILIAIPLPTIWKLHTTRARKIALTVLFFSTIIALVGSCFRQWAFETHDTNMLIPNTTNAIVCWIVVEPSLYLLVACLPGMYPLFNQILSKSARQHARVEHQNPSTHPVGTRGRTTSFPFTPLVDPEYGGAFGFSASGTKAKEAVRESVARQDTPDVVPMLDLRSMTEGNGVLMTTEVTVTQEQKIEDIIGLAI